MEKAKNTLKNNPKLRRFIIVGLVATVIDFGLLYVFKSMGLATIIANIMSTFIAFVFSFFANKHYTFQSTGGDLRREIILFTIVTLTGLWVLQSMVIAFVEPSLLVVFSAGVATFIAKLLATIVSTIWNYVLYSRVVFAHNHEGTDEKAAHRS